MNARFLRSFEIVTAIPGRIRLKFGGAPNSLRSLQEAADRIDAIRGVTETTVVADARSIVVHYAPHEIPLAEMVRSVQATLLPMSGTPALPAAHNTSIAAPVCPDHVHGSEDSFRQSGGDIHVLDRATQSSGRGRLTSERTGSALPAKSVRSILPRFDIRINHFFPGRLRLQVFKIRWSIGLAADFEDRLSQEPGVTSVETKLDGGFIIVRYDARTEKSASLLHKVQHALTLAIQALSGPNQSNPRLTAAKAEVRSGDLIQEAPRGMHPLVFPTVSIAAGAMTGMLPVAAVAGLLAFASVPTAVGAWEGLRERRFNVAQLDLAALLVLGTMGQFLTGGIMVWLIGLGELIRTKTMRKSRRAISELMSPAGQKAWVERQGSIVESAVDGLAAGDIVHVYPGDQVPVDGIVVDGHALVDQKLLTGESLPVSKQAGDAVFALTILADGQIRVRVEHIGSETRAGQVVQMIEDAPLSDTRVSNFAAKVGDRLVPAIFALALGTLLFTGDAARLASILILDFVTGIRVSAPTTILSAMTGAAKQGLFIKGGKAMESLAEVNAIVFDKTGTLTLGAPVVTEVVPVDPHFTENDVLYWAASTEANIKHPSARAIVDAANARGIAAGAPECMEYVMGQGVQALVDGKRCNVGSLRYLAKLGVDVSGVIDLIEHSSMMADSLALCAVDGRLIGLIAYADPPRAECERVLQALRDRGIERIVMLTGDNRRSADAIAGRLGITDVVADAFPEQKAAVVEKLRAEGYRVAVIGDGINDSPAFTRANVGISLQHGADVARETADVILLDGDLRALPRAIDLSRQAIAILKQNVNVIVAPTVVGIAAAVVGLSNPLVSTIINNGTTVATGLNALRPMFFRKPADLSALAE